MNVMLPISLQAPSMPYHMADSADELSANGLYLIGFGFDGTACFRKGTRHGPDALRDVSEDIESFSPYQNLDLEDCQFNDLGNLSLGDSDDAEQQWQHASDDFERLFASAELAKNKIKVITLGGEHSISYAPIKTYLAEYPDMVLIHLDAHADLRDGYLGYHFSHASIIRRALDHFGSGHELIQYGIRSGTKEEYQWMRENKTVRTSREDFLQSVRDIPANRPVYLTFDLDYFDPGIFPGTGTPEPGGEDFHSFIKLIKILAEKNFVGADVVELSPEIDSSGNSAVFAAKVVRELILCMTKGR
ncbi:agmatinase [Neptunicella marina]|uniref:Agmatinase n=2 Tax=Neptunicella marina TaxID=2125989 RepID=A0A8J6IVK6_9ALTE|nr:agmatinase [Neptunicella marina]